MKENYERIIILDFSFFLIIILICVEYLLFLILEYFDIQNFITYSILIMHVVLMFVLYAAFFQGASHRNGVQMAWRDSKITLPAADDTTSQK